MFFKDKKALIEALRIERSWSVLDVGFVGQAIKEDDADWPHALLKARTDYLYGVDLDFDENKFPPRRYLKASAEDFTFHSVAFDLIFAGDIIEHLSNPGQFLISCKKHLKPDGRLIITTPNAFNLFSLVEKITHDEPNANPDHTCYFNKRVLSVLLAKNGFAQPEFSYIYTLGTLWDGGVKRKILASTYWLASRLTQKFSETLVASIRKLPE